MSSESLKKVDGFFSRGGEAPFHDPNKVIIIGLDEPETPANWFAHCARLHAPDPDLPRYEAAVRALGEIPEPIDVYRDGAGRYVCLDGRRTLRVGRAVWNDLRLPVRVIIRQGTPKELFRYNMESHEKLLLTPMQYAKSILTFHKATGQDIPGDAEYFRVDERVIRYNLQLFDLDERLWPIVDARRLSVQNAAKLAVKPREAQWALWEAMAAADATRGAAATNAIDAAKRGEKVIVKDKTRTRPRPFLEKLQGQLKKAPIQDDVGAWLRFFLGGPLPKSARDDDQIKALLEAAGFKNTKRRASKDA